MDAPLVVFPDTPVQALLNGLWIAIILARFQRVAEALNNFVCVWFGPEDVHHLIEVAPDEVWNIAEYGQSRGIDLPDAEIRIHQIDAERRLVKERLKLCIRLPAQADQI